MGPQSDSLPHTMARSHRSPKPIPGRHHWYKSVTFTMDKLVEQHQTLMLSAMFGSCNMDFTEEERKDWFSFFADSQAIMEETVDLMEKLSLLRKKYLTQRECKPIEIVLKKGINLSDIDLRVIIDQLKYWGVVCNDVLHGMVLNDFRPGRPSSVPFRPKPYGRQVLYREILPHKQARPSESDQALNFQQKPELCKPHYGEGSPAENYWQSLQDEHPLDMQNQIEGHSLLIKTEEVEQQRENSQEQVGDHSIVLKEAEELPKSIHPALRDEQLVEGLQSQTEDQRYAENVELSNQHIGHESPTMQQNQEGEDEVEKDHLCKEETVIEQQDNQNLMLKGPIAQVQVQSEQPYDDMRQPSQPIEKTPSEEFAHQPEKDKNPYEPLEMKEPNEIQQHTEKEVEDEGKIIMHLINQMESRKEDLQKKMKDRQLKLTDQGIQTEEQEDIQTSEGNVHHIKIHCKLREDQLQKQIDEDNRELHNQELQLIEDSLQLYKDQLQHQGYKKKQQCKKSHASQKEVSGVNDSGGKQAVPTQKELIVKKQELQPRAPQPKKKRFPKEFVPSVPPRQEEGFQQDKQVNPDKYVEKNGKPLDQEVGMCKHRMTWEARVVDQQDKTKENKMQLGPGKLLAATPSTLFPVQGSAIKAEVKPNKMSPKKLPINPMVKPACNPLPDINRSKGHSASSKLRVPGSNNFHEQSKSHVQDKEVCLPVLSPPRPPSDCNSFRSLSRSFSQCTILPDIKRSDD